MVSTERLPTIWIRPENCFRFPPHLLTHPIAEWIYARPSMQRENKNILFMATRLFDEIDELQAEVERKGSEFDRDAYEKEALDALFFAVSLAANISHGYLESLDLPTLSSKLNGTGSRSGVFDQMREVAMNMPESVDVRKDVEMFLMLWFSYMRHAPIEHSPEKILRDVLKKNGTEVSGNYPKIYFSGKHPQTKKMLNPDESHLQFHWSKEALRGVRLMHGLPKDGLKPHQHLAFYDLIINFEQADKNRPVLNSLIHLNDADRNRYQLYQSGLVTLPETSYQSILKRSRSQA